MMAVSPMAFVGLKELCEALGIEKGRQVRGLTISAYVNEGVVVTIEEFVKVDNVPTLVHTVKRLADASKPVCAVCGQPANTCRQASQSGDVISTLTQS